MLNSLRYLDIFSVDRIFVPKNPPPKSREIFCRANFTCRNLHTRLYSNHCSMSLYSSAMPLANSKLVPWPENKSYDKQAIPVPGTKRPGQSRTLLTSGTYYLLLTNSLMQIIIKTVFTSALQLTRVIRLSETGVWGLVDEKTPNSLTTLDQLFNDSLQTRLDSPCLGRRQIISTNPLKFAPTYTWLTYGDVDLKRRYIGSALQSLFQQGVIGGGQLQTVGIWAPNCPGMSLSRNCCGHTPKLR